MIEPVKITIYGDSIMKGTLPDERFRYHFTIKPYLEKLEAMFPVTIRNRAVFGSCIDKGEKQLNKDLEKADIGSIALLEFGGNDCNYNWKQVAEEPQMDHLPFTTLSNFLETMEAMTSRLTQRGVKPVLMTLPPIDAAKYLKFIGRDGTDCKNILSWLGDVTMIYRFHEMYSNAVEIFAFEHGFKLIDIRSRFLDKRNYSQLISDDGIHPSEKGYELIFSIFAEDLSQEFEVSNQ